MLQKDAKLIFISSVNSSDQSTSFLFNLRNASEKMLNIVNYVCSDHRDDFNLQDAMMACPCYRLYIPTFITIDEKIKTTTNLLLEGAFTTELMGDAATVSRNTLHKIVGEAAMAQFDMCRFNTTSESAALSLSPTLFMYIDPAYTNNAEASGTGISAIVTTNHKPKKCFILGFEHFFLKDLTGAATIQIAACAATLIQAISLLHPFITKVCIAVEGNSSQDSAMAIATILGETSPLDAYFVHHVEKSTLLQWPIYLLGTDKSLAFESFIYAINSGTVCASQTIVSNTIKITYDPISYLIEQIKAIKSFPLKDGSSTYNAKQKNMSDDVLVAIVMAHFFALSEKHSFKKIKT